eukprot:489055_1
MGICQATQTKLETSKSPQNQIETQIQQSTNTTQSTTQPAVRSIRSNLSKHETETVTQLIDLLLNVKYKSYPTLINHIELKKIHKQWQLHHLQFFEHRIFRGREQSDISATNTFDNTIKRHLNSVYIQRFPSICNEQNDFLSTNISKPFTMDLFLHGYIHFNVLFIHNFDINILSICKLYIGFIVNVNENIMHLCTQLFHTFYPIDRMEVWDDDDEVIFPSEYLKQCATYSYINDFMVKHFDITQIAIYIALFIHDTILNGFMTPFPDDNHEDDKIIFYQINCLFKELEKYDNGYNGKRIVKYAFEIHQKLQFIRLNDYFNENLFDWEWNVTFVSFSRLGVLGMFLQDELSAMGKMINRYQMIYLIQTQNMIEKSRNDIRKFWRKLPDTKNMIQIDKKNSTDYETVYELNVSTKECKEFMAVKENYSMLNIQKQIINIIIDSELTYYGNYKLKKLWKYDEQIMKFNEFRADRKPEKLNAIIDKIYKRLLHCQTVCGMINDPKILIRQCMTDYILKTDNKRVQNYVKDLGLIEGKLKNNQSLTNTTKNDYQQPINRKARKQKKRRREQ